MRKDGPHKLILYAGYFLIGFLAFLVLVGLFNSFYTSG